MEKLKVNYDIESDVLYLSFGEPRPSFTKTFDDGVYVRYDLETEVLTGITIVDFSKRTDQLKGINLPGDVTFDKMTELIH